MLVSLYGAHCIVAVGPAVQAAVELMRPDLMTKVSLDADAATAAERSGDIVMVMQAIRPVAIAGDFIVEPWIKFRFAITAGHNLVPAIIFYTLLLAWPFSSYRRRALALALGVPVCTALVVWLVSLQFVGLFEIAVQNVAAHHGLSRSQSMALTTFLFNEGGGQWVLAILCSAVVAWVAARQRRSVEQPRTPEQKHRVGEAAPTSS